ncbi:hypothetical protein [Altererythrobacter sp. C41]|uniref:hypothetical protein n=1 Tax=Altererythrobacter sp. C41 TaxID=2806021 RepID=UPI0019344433|nr:hypothetical protein [Altererythrobacter sp. C41]MBM0169717.1 hypothetical protein [Altererythrobacter sp. C41]
MRLTIALAALPALALAACDAAPTDDTATDADTTETPAPVEPDSTAPADDGAAGPDGDTASIPAALQGRWGLVAADCTSTRGDAKGLIEITGDTITFYESRATLGDIAERSDDSIRAIFSFTGEGMTWTRDMALAAQDGGEELVRTEYGEDAMADPLRYGRCSQGDA